MAGRVSEAVGVVQSSYPGLLEGNQQLLFRLKCRQFVEMIAGCDRAEVAPSLSLAPSSSRVSRTQHTTHNNNNTHTGAAVVLSL